MFTLPPVKEIFVESAVVGSDTVPPARATRAPLLPGLAAPDVVCTTWPVVLATCAGVVFLQLCVLATCLTCLYTQHRRQTREDLLLHLTLQHFTNIHLMQIKIVN